MSDRKQITIYCFECGLKVGNILKGSWKQEAKGICPKCLKEYKIKKVAENLSRNNYNNPGEVFKDLLGGK